MGGRFAKYGDAKRKAQIPFCRTSPLTQLRRLNAFQRLEEDVATLKENDWIPGIDLNESL